MKTYKMKLIGSSAMVLVALTLSACGGGGELAACGSNNAQINTILNPGGCPANAAVAPTGLASLTLSLTDASGAATTSVAPGQNGTLQALVKDGKGSAAPNVAVTFTTSDKTGGFVPASGTALTDASGVARVGLVAGTQAGGFTATAGTSVGAAATSGTLGYSVAFPTLTLSALSIAPATLSAGGNASVNVTVSSGSAPYAPPLSVFISSPCITAGKASIGSPVLTQSGIAAASYTDKGCGVADVITASVTFGGATVTQTGTITVLPATAGSIKFVSADTTNIALKGTGGFGRQEFATLKFEVSDNTGNKLPGKLVDFTFSDSNIASTVGGLTLNPGSATSAADGTVTTLVSAGTIPTSVRVVATVRGSSPLLTTLSNILVISTGVPDQRHFSLATATGNCEGLDVDGVCSYVTATLGDHFGNPAPDGTAVNFTAEGGVIGASCVTGSMSGTCTVLLRASNPRPADGRVTVLAYALGEEDLFDANGNNVYDAGDTFTDKSPDIFRDDNENGTWTPGEACVGPNTNTTCSTAGDGQYNGVLRNPQVPSAQALYVKAQLVQLFSGSNALINFVPAALVCPAGGTATVQVSVTDEIGNIMPAGTTIEFSALFGAGAGTVVPTSIKVPNVVLGVGQALIIPTYTATVACPGTLASGQLFVTVTTPTTATITKASMPIN
ncbi:MAG: hypothetical protein RJB64_818 [Pseudomonadota bacterium]